MLALAYRQGPGQKEARILENFPIVRMSRCSDMSAKLLALPQLHVQVFKKMRHFFRASVVPIALFARMTSLYTFESFRTSSILHS